MLRAGSRGRPCLTILALNVQLGLSGLQASRSCADREDPPLGAWTWASSMWSEMAVRSKTVTRDISMEFSMERGEGPFPDSPFLPALGKGGGECFLFCSLLSPSQERPKLILYQGPQSFSRGEGIIGFLPETLRSFRGSILQGLSPSLLNYISGDKLVLT